MLRNYLKTAWRNLRNNKFFSAINILGLAAGMAVALLIGLWVYHEYSYDRFLPNADKVYRVQRNFDSNGDTLTFQTVSLKLADVLRQQVPGIEYVAESDWMVSHGLIVGEKKIYTRGGVVASDFLKIFRYPLLTGSRTSVFQDPYSIVLTESLATTLFGSEDPINKTVRFDNKNDLKVTGIIKDIPSNSSLQFNFLVPFSYLDQTSESAKRNRVGSFADNAYQMFVKLRDDADERKVSAMIRNIEKTETDNSNAMRSNVILQPLRNWHLYSNYKNGKETAGFMEYVRMFAIIGVLVLLIACINFVNITTARSEKRAREVGVRKAIGSNRKSLVFQFLAESILLTLISFCFSLLFVQLALPSFNRLTGTTIFIPYSNPYFWLSMLCCVLITAVIAGSRPAFYLSSFQPVKVLKGTLRIGRAASLPRKVLVVVQFSCSVALIISTIIIYQQIHHAKQRPTGYDINRVMMTNLNSDLTSNYEVLRNEMMQEGITTSVTRASSPATEIYWHSDVDMWPGKQANETIEMGVIMTGDNYFQTLGIQFGQGRDFASEFDSTSVVFNEMAIRQMRIKDPLGQKITWGGRQFTITGIVKDALVVSPFKAAEPTMFMRNKDVNVMMYRLSPRVRTSEAVARLTELFGRYNPAFPYKYEFADERYANKFKLEMLIGRLSGIFAALAVLISCLGLFGLAVYMAERRTKEIGIRKVLGASVAQVWLLLSKDFLILVLISCVIASPLALYFLQDWLEKYEYRIAIGPMVFVIAAATALLITIATVSFQAIKAAVANPVKSLRNE